MAFGFGALLPDLISSTGSLFSTAMSAGLSSRQAKRQYNYQRKLNQQAYNLTQQGYREMYGNLRTGLENAGYNPILATSMGTGGNFTSGTAASANAVQTPNFADIMNSASNAYRTYKLDKDLNDANVDLVKQQIEESKARIRNLDKDTELKPYDKPLKTIKEVVSNPDIVPKVVKKVYGEIVSPHVGNAKSYASKKFWNYYDAVNDFATALKWNAKHSKPFDGTFIGPSYFKGTSKRLRIQKGLYNIRQLKYNPHIN